MEHLNPIVTYVLTAIAVYLIGYLGYAIYLWNESRFPFPDLSSSNSANRFHGNLFYVTTTVKKGIVRLEWGGKSALFKRGYFLEIFRKESLTAEYSKDGVKCIEGACVEQVIEPGKTYYYLVELHLDVIYIPPFYFVPKAWRPWEFIRFTVTTPPEDEVERIQRAIRVKELEQQLASLSKEPDKPKPPEDRLEALRNDLKKVLTTESEIDSIERDFLQKIEESNLAPEEKLDKLRRIQALVAKARDAM
jgi:hypothetical protein